MNCMIYSYDDKIKIDFFIHYIVAHIKVYIYYK
jgi:hypothetical protein